MIEVKGLHKRYKLNRKQRRKEGKEFLEAVDGVDLTCRPGRVFTLLGPNGAGKTTALRLIATMLRPTSGSILVNGFDTVREPREVRRSLGFLTGSTGLYDRLTATETVRYYADLFKMERGKFERRKDELFSLLGIDKFADQRIGKMSTGMKQKVSIARTMIHDPAVVVFDEPTAGLDVITSRSIMDLIRRCRDEGKTVIFSTHIMGEVSLISDDLAIIHDGRLRFSGSYQDFTSRMKTTSLEDEFIRLVEAA